MMEQYGYEVKQQKGVISFRAPGQERFTRLRSSTLGNKRLAILIQNNDRFRVEVA
jgi:signal recognition particle receptor subunit beta